MDDFKSYELRKSIESGKYDQPFVMILDPMAICKIYDLLLKIINNLKIEEIVSRYNNTSLNYISMNDFRMAFSHPQSFIKKFHQSSIFSLIEIVSNYFFNDLNGINHYFSIEQALFRNNINKIFELHNIGFVLETNTYPYYIRPKNNDFVEQIITETYNLSFLPKGTEPALSDLTESLKLAGKKDFTIASTPLIKFFESVIKTQYSVSNTNDIIKQLPKGSLVTKIDDLITAIEGKGGHGDNFNKEGQRIVSEEEYYLMLHTCLATLKYIIKTILK